MENQVPAIRPNASKCKAKSQVLEECEQKEGDVYVHSPSCAVLLKILDNWSKGTIDPKMDLDLS